MHTNDTKRNLKQLLEVSYNRVGLGGGVSLLPVPTLLISAIFHCMISFSLVYIFAYTQACTALPTWAQPWHCQCMMLRTYPWVQASGRQRPPHRQQPLLAPSLHTLGGRGAAPPGRVAAPAPQMPAAVCYHYSKVDLSTLVELTLLRILLIALQSVCFAPPVLPATLFHLVSGGVKSNVLRRHNLPTYSMANFRSPAVIPGWRQKQSAEPPLSPRASSIPRVAALQTSTDRLAAV